MEPGGAGRQGRCLAQLDQRRREWQFDPSLPLALRIADVFGLALEQVFFREDNDFRK